MGHYDSGENSGTAPNAMRVTLAVTYAPARIGAILDVGFVRTACFI